MGRYLGEAKRGIGAKLLRWFDLCTSSPSVGTGERLRDMDTDAVCEARWRGEPEEVLFLG